MALTSFCLALTTFFSDSKLSTQIGTLVVIIPMSIFLGIYYKHPELLGIFYWLPHFPMSVIIFEIMYPPTVPLLPGYIDNSIPLAWIALFLNIPCYFGLYIYLDAIIPDTYGISKHPCFCFRKRPV